MNIAVQLMAFKIFERFFAVIAFVQRLAGSSTKPAYHSSIIRTAAGTMDDIVSKRIEAAG
jgi:hypothetical protein